MQTQFHGGFDIRNEEHRTVLPETMTEATLEAKRRYLNKRLLLHYLQPHAPFLGPAGQNHFDLGQIDFRVIHVS